MNFTQFLKFLSISVLIVAFIVTVGYLSGYEDATQNAKTKVNEMMFEQCVLPKSGGVCKNYCLINNKDLYEINVEYKKVEETK